MLVFALLFGLSIVLAYPLGRYLAAIMQNQSMKIDPLFHWIEKPFYALIGTDPQQGMNAKTYSLSFIYSCLVIGLLVWLLFMFQAYLPLNPNHAPNMSWDLALHSMISFLTNTNQQHYSGQSQLSYLSQMVGIVGLQVITPMMGLAVVVATLRALFYKRLANQAITIDPHQDQTSAEDSDPSSQQQQSTFQPDPQQRSQDNQINVGNYWADVIRPSLRFLLPLCLIWSLMLNSQGVPSTFDAGPKVAVMDQQAEMKLQQIPLGPVAPMVAIKTVGQ